MKIIAQYHLTDREVEVLKKLASTPNGFLEDRRPNREFFDNYAGEIQVLCNNRVLAYHVDEAWSETIMISSDGRQALAKHPQPHTVEIEIVVYHEAEQ